MADNNGELVYNRHPVTYQFWYQSLEPYIEKLAAPGELPLGVLRCPSETRLATAGAPGHYAKNLFLNSGITGHPASYNNIRLQNIPRPFMWGLCENLNAAFALPWKGHGLWVGCLSG